MESDDDSASARDGGPDASSTPELDDRDAGVTPPGDGEGEKKVDAGQGGELAPDAGAGLDASNAGAYGSLGEAKGVRLKALFEDSVCGKAQVFLSGHDHDREWLEPTCGTTFIVSGAAAKLRDMPGHGTKSRWAGDTKRGFLWIEVSGETMVGVFYDEDGQANYEDAVQL